MKMELLTEQKNRLKGKVDKLYQCYGHLCATNPLPMIISSVVIVLICSLPLLSHPVFERTATFIFGRIQLGKYRTNISLSSTKNFDKTSILVQQIELNLNISKFKSDENLPSEKWNEKWKFFQRALEISGVKNLSNFFKSSQSFNWTSDCLHVSRKPFYKSPQTRLIYPRGRFYKQLRKWFSKRGCLLVSPSTLSAIEERTFNDLPEQFKELLIGFPVSFSGLSDESQDKNTHFKFTVSVFLKNYDERFSASMKRYFSSRENSTVSSEATKTYKIKYLPTEDDNHMELILLSVTYVLVFFYILFSVGKIKMLKSRWGLAFSAVMTIIMSMIMALGLCASLDLLPTTLTITEIFPYVVIVIGLENVLTITKSVMSTDGDMDVSAKVAKGMGKEGWYITKNLVAELTILGAGYFTRIPSLQEFCTFAYVGVLSDFFIQMVFFAPVLSVDIRRAEICHLEQITIGQDFAVGFNLMQKTALTLVPPSPPKSLRSKYFERLRKRIVQKVLMTAVVIYIIFAVYNKVQEEKSDTVGSKRKSEIKVEMQDNMNPRTDGPKTLAATLQAKTGENIFRTSDKSLKSSTFADGSGTEALSSGDVASWEFLSRQHWPELLTFYHIAFNEKTLLILPTIQVSMNITVNETEPISMFKFTAASKIEDFLLVSSLIVCSAASIALIWLVFCCFLKRRRRLSYSSDQSLFEVRKITYRGHKHCIETICSDQQYIVTASIAGIVKVWDNRSTHCVMEISPNNRKTSGKASNSNLRRRRHSNSRGFPAIDDEGPACSVWCLDCKYNMLAIAFSTGTIEVHVINGKKMIACLQEEEAVVDVKIASRNTIIIGRIDGIVDIVEINRSQLDSVEYLQADWQIDAADDNKTFGFRIKHRIKAHIGPIENLVVNSGTAFCISADMVKVYEMDDAHCCNSFCLHERQITTVHQIKEINGFVMAIGCEDGHVCLVNTTGETTVEYRWHTSLIQSICSKSNALASLDVCNKISVWSPDGELQFAITENVPPDAYAARFLNSAILCILSQKCGCLHHASDGSLFRRFDLESDSCGGAKQDLVCYPKENSFAVAKRTCFELISFPNLSQLESEKADR